MRHPRLEPPRRATLLVAHGSRDPRAAPAATRLAQAVRNSQHEPQRAVAVAYLDFTTPAVGPALTRLAVDGVREIAVVPMLFAPGYHLRVDLPAAIAEVRAGRPELTVQVAAALAEPPDAGEPDLLLDALDARLRAVGGAESDGVVLTAAGSSDSSARAVVDALAARWSVRGRPVVAAYATGPGQRLADAVRTLRDQGCTDVAVSALFSAPGRLYDATRRTARAAGVSAVADPLGADPALVELVARRAESAYTVGTPRF